MQIMKNIDLDYQFIYCSFNNLKNILRGDKYNNYRNKDINGIKVYKIKEDGNVYLKPLNGKYDIIEVKDKRQLRASRLLHIQKAAMRF